jgi:hypothetical protein
MLEVVVVIDREDISPCSASVRPTTGPATAWVRLKTLTPPSSRTEARNGSGSLSPIFLTAITGSCER